MGLWVAAECYQMPTLLACRAVSPRSSTRGTGREAVRTEMSGSDMLGGWPVRAGGCYLISSCACHSDEMMRTTGRMRLVASDVQ